MSHVSLIVAVVGLTACFLFSIAAHSLRDFSRRRLAECCAARGMTARFGEILKRYETIFIACDTIAVIGLVAFLAGSAVTLDLLPLQLRSGSVGRAWGLAALLVAIAVTFRLILPWTISRVAGEPFLCRFWPLLRTTGWVMGPVLFIVRPLDRLTHRVAGLPEPTNDDAATISEEIRSVVDEGRREGLIEAEAGTMIQRVIELQDEDIGAVMTPRTEMVTLRAEATIEDARRTFIEAGHSRVPVVGEGIDDILGILYAKDLLSQLDGDTKRAQVVRGFVREPFYVPMTTGVDTVLETMKRERVHMAIVVDEYGGVAGLVTLEDVIEEIVGDIVDEYDPAEENGILRSSPTTLEVEGWVHIDDLNEEFSLALPEDEGFDTLAGFVVDELSRVPETGERFSWQNLTLMILDADPRKVNRVRIEILPADAVESRSEEDGS